MYRSILIISAVFSFGLVNFSANSASSNPFHHSFGEWRQYHQHWLAVCPDAYDPTSDADYLRSCWASTAPNSNGVYFSQRLSVSRDRKTGALGIRFVAPRYADIAKSGTLTIRFSGGATWTKPWSGTLKDIALNEFQFTASDDVNLLLSQMRRGNWLVFEIPMEMGKQSLQFSTIELSAAMVFLERYSHRKP